MSRKKEETLKMKKSITHITKRTCKTGLVEGLSRDGSFPDLESKVAFLKYSSSLVDSRPASSSRVLCNG